MVDSLGRQTKPGGDLAAGEPFAGGGPDAPFLRGQPVKSVRRRLPVLTRCGDLLLGLPGPAGRADRFESLERGVELDAGISAAFAVAQPPAVAELCSSRLQASLHCG